MWKGSKDSLTADAAHGEKSSGAKVRSLAQISDPPASSDQQTLSSRQNEQQLTSRFGGAENCAG